MTRSTRYLHPNDVTQTLTLAVYTTDVLVTGSLATRYSNPLRSIKSAGNGEVTSVGVELI